MCGWVFFITAIVRGITDSGETVRGKLFEGEIFRGETIDVWEFPRSELYGRKYSKESCPVTGKVLFY